PPADRAGDHARLVLPGRRRHRAAGARRGLRRDGGRAGVSAGAPVCRPTPRPGTRAPMARPIWKGTVSFGLVSVPVKAYTAVRDHAVHFNQLERSSGARVRYEKVSEKSGKALDADDIQLGYEIGK